MAGHKKDTSAPVIERTIQNIAAAVTITMVCYTHGLNVREYPDTRARVLRVLKDGEQIEVDNNIAAPNGWAAVVGGGFVMRRYLK